MLGFLNTEVEALGAVGFPNESVPTPPSPPRGLEMRMGRGREVHKTAGKYGEHSVKEKITIDSDQC